MYAGNYQWKKVAEDGIKHSIWTEDFEVPDPAKIKNQYYSYKRKLEG